ncbi:MAG: HEAT repeat domain-containing protein [Planctomycetes bacterium]|nr:HEAT repeat domain-containing protein [Planctomycetota bacterium]
MHITHLFPPSDERYTVDVQAGKLLETEAIGKDFHVRGQGRRQELYHGQKLLGHVSSWHSAAVAPDQQQVIWTGRDREQALHYYDAKEGVVQVVAKGWFAEGWDEGRLLWFKDDALKPPATPQALSADWKPFEHSPYPPPPRQWKDQRKPITDYLTFTLSCDKKEYKLHEPVKVTMTLTNRGEQELKVHRPRICWGILELAVKRPDFGSLITRHWDIKEFSPVVLKPGASVSGTEAIELTRVGTHDLDGEVNLSTLQALNPSAQFSGRLKAAPVSFAVQSSAEDVKLLAAKMDRLMGELRAQHSKAPNDTKLWMPAQGDMREVGEEAVPFLLDALRQETDARLRARLVYVLQHIASPAALPAFHEALASNAPDCQEFAIGGFYQLCARNTPAKPEAVEALIGALSRDLPQELRNWTLRYLTLIHDPAVKAAFEKALEAEDPFVAPKAGRYVAGWEGKNLADWLATAAQQPTKIRFVAARAIINELRATWHIDKFGDLSGLAWNDVSKGGEALARFRQVLSVWEAWARENPRASATFFRKPSDDKDDE